jgi:hypothetical protein
MNDEFSTIARLVFCHLDLNGESLCRKEKFGIGIRVACGLGLTCTNLFGGRLRGSTKLEGPYRRRKVEE